MLVWLVVLNIWLPKGVHLGSARLQNTPQVSLYDFLLYLAVSNLIPRSYVEIQAEISAFDLPLRAYDLMSYLTVNVNYAYLVLGLHVSSWPMRYVGLL